MPSDEKTIGIVEKILFQVFSNLDKFEQFLLFRDDDTYFSSSDLVICLSCDEYCFLREVLNAQN